MRTKNDKRMKKNTKKDMEDAKSLDLRVAHLRWGFRGTPSRTKEAWQEVCHRQTDLGTPCSLTLLRHS